MENIVERPWSESEAKNEPLRRIKNTLDTFTYQLEEDRYRNDPKAVAVMEALKVIGDCTAAEDIVDFGAAEFSVVEFFRWGESETGTGTIEQWKVTISPRAVDYTCVSIPLRGRERQLRGKVELGIDGLSFDHSSN